MDEVIWEEPPAHGNKGAGRWKPVLDQLRARPGVWALVAADGSVTTAHQIKKGLLGGASAGEFEARSVGGSERGRGKIYARYVGGES